MLKIAVFNERFLTFDTIKKGLKEIFSIELTIYFINFKITQKKIF